MNNPVPQVADFSDQTGIFDPNSVDASVTLIGCGGIGASAVPTLVTMGLDHYVLWDGDRIEPRNVTTNPVFRTEDIGRLKVERLREYLIEFGAKSVEIHPEAYTGQQPLTGVVVSGVDTMAARQAIWDHIAYSAVSLYMDGRIGGVNLTLLTVEPGNLDHIEWYERHFLFPDSEASALPCTQRTIVYPAVTLGAYMASNLATWYQQGQGQDKRPPNQIDQGFGGEMFFRAIYVDES